MKFIALLRGINVGGKNKVAMTELKVCFEKLGFNNVAPYINSGNIIFDSMQTDTAKLVSICESAIEKQFGFHVVCLIVAASDLLEAMKHAPEWWNKDDGKHNAIFVISPKKAEEILAEMGDIKPEYENGLSHSSPLTLFRVNQL